MVKVCGVVSKPLSAHVVEEVLLGVAGVRAEMGLDEMLQAFFGWFAFWEVKLANGLLDPDVDWESVLEAVGEKQNAVGDFFADAGEFAESFAGLWRREGADGFEVEFVGRDDACGFEQVWGAKSHFAGAELGLGE